MKVPINLEAMTSAELAQLRDEVNRVLDGRAIAEEVAPKPNGALFADVPPKPTKAEKKALEKQKHCEADWEPTHYKFTGPSGNEEWIPNDVTVGPPSEEAPF